MECSVSLSVTFIFVPFLFWTFWILYDVLVFQWVSFFMNGFRKGPLRVPCTILILLFSRNWLLMKMQIGLKQNAPRKMSASSLNLNYFVLILRWMCTAVGTSSLPRLQIHLVTNHLKHNTNCQTYGGDSRLWKSFWQRLIPSKSNENAEKIMRRSRGKSFKKYKCWVENKGLNWPSITAAWLTDSMVLVEIEGENPPEVTGSWSLREGSCSSFKDETW